MIQVAAWNAKEVIASAERMAELDATGLVRAEILEPPDRWSLQAGSRVGVAVGDGWELRVVPRIAIAQLMFLVSYSRTDGWRSDVAGYSEGEDLFAAVASGFASHAERAIRPAPLSGYLNFDEAAPILRGRLRITDQISRRPAMPLPLEIAYDDFKPDISENRLVLGAAEVLLRLPLVPARTRSRLLRIRAALDGVQATRSSASIRVPPPTRLNHRYAEALALAKLILQGNGISTATGGVTSTTFSFDMNSVFEDFLSRALADAVARRGARVLTQDDQRYLDVERVLRLKPDITIWQRGSCVAVLDAKYKPLTSASFPNADAYQMLAYCTAYGLDRGTLVYASDALGTERTHRVEAAGVTIDVRALDVTRPHGEVLGQVDALATSLLGGEGFEELAA